MNTSSETNHERTANWERVPRAVLMWGAGVVLVAGYLIAPQVYRWLSAGFYAGEGMIAPGTEGPPWFVAGFALMLALVFISALITEKAVARAGYGPALGKSFLVALLVFGVATFYQREALASRARVGRQLHLTVPRGSDPLVSGVWVTTIALILFGPVDLFIAKWQRRRAGAEAGATTIGFDPEK